MPSGTSYVFMCLRGPLSTDRCRYSRAPTRERYCPTTIQIPAHHSGNLDRLALRPAKHISYVACC